MKRPRITQNIIDEANFLGGKSEIIRNVSKIALEIINAGDISMPELESLLNMLNDSIRRFDKRFVKFIDKIEFGK